MEACEDCGKLQDVDMLIHTYNGGRICMECADKEYVQCDECSLAIKSNEAIDVAGYNVCPSCAGR